jgi:hypothetical protein
LTFWQPPLLGDALAWHVRDTVPVPERVIV